MRCRWAFVRMTPVVDRSNTSARYRQVCSSPMTPVVDRAARERASRTWYVRSWVRWRLQTVSRRVSADHSATTYCGLYTTSSVLSAFNEYRNVIPFLLPQKYCVTVAVIELQTIVHVKTCAPSSPLWHPHIFVHMTRIIDFSATEVFWHSGALQIGLLLLLLILRTFSAVPTYVMKIAGKFHWNPSIDNRW